jgi:hypothetical protein
VVSANCEAEKAAKTNRKGDRRMRHKKLLTLTKLRRRFLNELMYDFDKKSKQNIRAIYYIVSTSGSPLTMLLAAQG